MRMTQFLDTNSGVMIRSSVQELRCRADWTVRLVEFSVAVFHRAAPGTGIDAESMTDRRADLNSRRVAGRRTYEDLSGACATREIANAERRFRGF